MKVTSLINDSLRTVGLELRRTASHHTDPYRDQVWLLKPAPVCVVFDAGAHDGGTGSHYRRLFPDAAIYSFEPTESSFQTLAQRAAGDRNWFPAQAAVGEVAGQATLYLNAFDQTNSLLPNDHRAAAVVHPTQVVPVGKIDVPVVTLGEVCEQRNIETIDVLKVDIQG